jgi:hypothetical protein
MQTRIALGDNVFRVNDSHDANAFGAAFGMPLYGSGK